MDKRQRRVAVGAGALILCLVAVASLSTRPQKSAAGPGVGFVGDARTGAEGVLDVNSWSPTPEMTNGWG